MKHILKITAILAIPLILAMFSLSCKKEETVASVTKTLLGKWELVEMHYAQKPQPIPTQGIYLEFFNDTIVFSYGKYRFWIELADYIPLGFSYLGQRKWWRLHLDGVCPQFSHYHSRDYITLYSKNRISLAHWSSFSGTETRIYERKN